MTLYQLSFFKGLFLTMCTCVCLSWGWGLGGSGMDVSASALGDQRGCWIPWSWSYSSCNCIFSKPPVMAAGN